MASGPWLPERLLSNGGQKILEEPEFFFELEMKELATHYPTPIKAVISDAENPAPKPDQPKPSQQEKELYEGDNGRDDLKKLLALPPGERQVLSTSAAYRLGREYIHIDDSSSGTNGETPAAKPSDSPSAEQPESSEDKAAADEAIGYFRQVRELAQKGFFDPDGLAAASFGWEAYIELHRGAYDKAAALYLQQLAAGDWRAVDSLKVVAVKLTDDAVSNPLLRQIRTAEILCYHLNNSGYDRKNSEAVALSTKWLAAVEKTRVERVEEAERLGWMAYGAGDYNQAERWLKRADPEAGLALWLRAKLFMREGKVAEAAAVMSKAIRKIPNTEIRGAEEAYYYGHTMPSKVAAGDLGMLLLARSDFESAFHAFQQGNHWEDTAYVAERVFTVGELKKIVDREFKADPKDDQPTPNKDSYWYDRRLTPDHRVELRWLLGRRLVRLGKFSEARPYLPVQFREVLDRYADALKRADDKKAKPEDRARALFDAALIARRQGMELMGTEVEPDETLFNGLFPADDVQAERLKGEYITRLYSESEKTETAKVIVPVSTAEHDRLAKNKVEPEKRFHYRYTAADLAWRSAKLLPDNLQITADVLNTAGSWLKGRDDAAADRFVHAIERRCPNTDIGRAVLKKHWFVDQKGPWSSAVQAP